MVKATVSQVYRHLPLRMLCEACGEKDCVRYAIKLVQGVRGIEECPYTSPEKKKKISELVKPAVDVIEIGSEPYTIKVGGEYVMYRHELRFNNPTALFIEVNDLMNDIEVSERIEFVKQFKINRLGRELKPDGLAVVCKTKNAEKYIKLVKEVAGEFEGPVILSAEDAEALEKSAQILSKRKPLLHTTDFDEVDKLIDVAQKNNASIGIHAKNIKQLIDHAKKIYEKGLNRIVLDPGVESGPRIGETVNRYSLIRASAVAGRKGFNHPLIGFTSNIYVEAEDRNISAFREACTACMLLSRYANIIVLKTIEKWAVLPILVYRQSLYTDPQTQPTVEARLYEINNPDKETPVMLTTNSANTFHSVVKDLEDAGIPAYLLALDTGGLAVSVAVAAEKISPSEIKEALTRSKAVEKTGSRILIIPGTAAMLKEEIEKATGWHVVVGPQDSSEISAFMKELFKQKNTKT